jgi:hypothetical protein
MTPAFGFESTSRLAMPSASETIRQLPDEDAIPPKVDRVALLSKPKRRFAI